jgi:hypothetical protein
MMVLVAIYVVVFASILIFFQTFKYHVWKVLVEEYMWNRVQDEPLSILSMDIDGQPVVMQMNKFLFKQYPQDLIDKLRGNISYQIFGSTDPSPNLNFGYRINISDMVISGKAANPDCGCTKVGQEFEGGTGYVCNDNCAQNMRGNDCGLIVYYFFGKKDTRDSTKCFNAFARYNMIYPFPLSFNGTWNFITNLTYEIEEFYE